MFKSICLVNNPYHLLISRKTRTYILTITLGRPVLQLLQFPQGQGRGRGYYLASVIKVCAAGFCPLKTEIVQFPICYVLREVHSLSGIMGT